MADSSEGGGVGQRGRPSRCPRLVVKSGRLGWFYASVVLPDLTMSGSVIGYRRAPSRPRSGLKREGVGVGPSYCQGAFSGRRPSYSAPMRPKSAYIATPAPGCQG